VLSASTIRPSLHRLWILHLATSRGLNARHGVAQPRFPPPFLAACSHVHANLIHRCALHREAIWRTRTRWSHAVSSRLRHGPVAHTLTPLRHADHLRKKHLWASDGPMRKSLVWHRETRRHTRARVRGGGSGAQGDVRARREARRRTCCCRCEGEGGPDPIQWPFSKP
jgi:hypothetical protein